MSSQGGLRQRGDKVSKKKVTVESIPGDDDAVLLKAANSVKKSKGSEWDFKLALALLTVLAFITRFYGISHPDQVVFDEVHFGKVCVSYKLLVTRLTSLIVRVFIPPTNLLLRCPSTFR
jgi:dolichyl-phosphate-mannose-protein mannosyltransferase